MLTANRQIVNVHGGQALPAETWRVTLLIGWICLAPSMPGTMLRDWYAYALAGCVTLFLTSSPNWAEQLLRAWLQPSSLGLLVGLFGTWLTTVLTPLQVTASDQFQLAREFYPPVLIAGMPALWRGMTASQGHRFCEQFARYFLGACGLGFVLQNFSSAFFDIMLQYYYAEFNEQARGFMTARPGLTFGNPNILSLAISFVGITLATDRSASLAKVATSIGLSGALIAWTGSRTGLFAFVMGLGLLGLVRVGRLIACLIVFGVGLAVASLFVDFSAYTDALNDLIFRFLHDRSSMQEREDIWTALLTTGEWPNNSLFGLGPAKQNEAIFDSGYVLVLYRYGYFGLCCAIWWQAALLFSGIFDVIQGDPTGLGLRRASLAVCFSCANYAMAPLTDPRLCALYLLLISTTTVSYCPAALMVPRRPPRPVPLVGSPEIRPCAS